MPQHLPEELLDRIIYFVASWHPAYNSWVPQHFRETLLSICLASKTFYRLARPHLYKAFSNHAEKREVQWIGLGPLPAQGPRATITSCPPLLHDVCARYLRTICIKPEFGEMLESASLSMTDHESSEVHQRVSIQEHVDLALFQKRVQDFWFGTAETAKFRDHLYHALLKKTPDATMRLTLLM